MAKPTDWNDLKGTRFGRLTVLCQGKSRGTNSRAVCQCDCGEVKEFILGNLKSGRSQSCGCLHSERSSERARKRFSPTRRKLRSEVVTLSDFDDLERR